MACRSVSVLVLLISFVGTALADGMYEEPIRRSSYCVYYENAHYILNQPTIEDIRHEVEKRYDHALDVSLSRRAHYSTSPLFTWAIEAKTSCARALGYLKRWKIWRPKVKDEHVQKCECFHSRMTAYLR